MARLSCRATHTRNARRRPAAAPAGVEGAEQLAHAVQQPRQLPHAREAQPQPPRHHPLAHRHLRARPRVKTPSPPPQSCSHPPRGVPESEPPPAASPTVDSYPALRPASQRILDAGADSLGANAQATAAQRLWTSRIILAAAGPDPMPNESSLLSP